MVSEFENNWAIILGGSSGLGFASALKLAHHGMNICIIHRNSRVEMPAIKTRFDQILLTGVKLLTYNIDILSEEKRKFVITDLKEKMGSGDKVKCLLHSIAKGSLKKINPKENNHLNMDDFEITANYMAFSIIPWIQNTLQQNLFDQDSRVLAFTSEGSKKPLKNYAAVSAAKAALEAIIRNISIEFSDFGIRANCIQAGITDTASMRLIPESQQIKESNTIRNPFNRLTQPEDIANVVYLLCKAESAWINGTVIIADGGESLK